MLRSMRITRYFLRTTDRCIYFGLVLAAVLPLFFSPSESTAAPFAKNFQFTQPDQVRITLWGTGDEFHAVFETLTGYTVLFDPGRQAYFYAERPADGKSLVSTGVLAHYPTPPGLAKHIRIDPAAAAAAARAKRAKWNEETGLSKRWSKLKSQTLHPQYAPGQTEQLPSPPPDTTTGDKVGLTLLIDFPDAPATIGKSEIEAYLNGDSYSGFGNNGSVKQYFRDVSGSRLDYTNVVITYVRMTKPKSYYNNTALDCGAQGRLLIGDALAILKARSDYSSTILPSLSALSTDESGRVLAFNVFFAGGNSGVWSFGLWPHYWVLSSPIPLGNGKSLFPYQITDLGSSLQLGTFCHENGHMLCGFPDIYDYDQDSVGGAGVFCLMNSGGYGTNPVQVGAYLKLAAGWATATDLDATTLTGSLVAAPNSGYDQLYRYRRPGVATEYFLLENRQKAGRDSYLPGGGIAVWHIDEMGDKDNQSLAANPSHQNYEVTLVQADSRWDFQNNFNQGDPFDLYYHGNGAAGYAGRLDDSSNPHAHWWDGSASAMKLSTFSVPGGTMTFKFEPGGGALPAPVLDAMPGITLGTSNTISWSEVSPGAATAQQAGPPPTGGQPPVPAKARLPLERRYVTPDQGEKIPSPPGPSWATTVLGEDFEESFPGTRWELYGNPTWGATGVDRHAGSKSGWCGSSGLPPENGYSNNMNAWMVYGPFSLTGSSGASVSFWYKNLSEPSLDSFKWMASVDGDSFHGYQASGDHNSWRSELFDLSNVPNLGNLNGRGQVWLAFQFGSDATLAGPGYKGAYIDDIVISKDPATAETVQYYAECADNAGFASPVNSGWIIARRWTFADLTLGKSYWYRVKAKSGQTEGGWSNVEHSLQENLPTISGTPATTVAAGSPYSFIPTATRATGFGIQNRPPWASFNTGTGALTGTPTSAEVGTYPNIVISAGNVAGTASLLPPFSITVTSSSPVLSVVISGSGGGSVTSSPVGISCINGSSTGCSAPFASGSNVALFATPNGDSTFGAWSGACVGAGACSVSMTSNRTVTATFNAAPNVKVGETSYQTLQAACAAAADGATIRAREIEFAENVIFGHRQVQLRGGYNAAFSSNAGHYTPIKGSLKLRNGPLRVDKIRIR